MKRTIGIVALLFCFTLAAPELWAAEDVQLEDSKWHSWVELGGYYNSRNVVGSGTARGEATAFVPLIGGQQDLLFGQVSGKLFEGEV